ncbi:histone deacetylase family protein [Anthocerotibacter panamensis]|uniref:histone deacetylase family protein n=1 Tax=Anthocerotibacter panamensis TaxID=2857077 RepID=UPI001C407253|nr:histone deacetylase [Anthocerotibacter panamensis]
MLPLVYSPIYVIPLPEGHRFPMAKFGLLRDYLVDQGVASEEQFHLPQAPAPEVLALVHEASYVTSFCTGTQSPQQLRRIGLPWSPALVQRTCTAVGGTILTARLALAHGLACNTAGGTHHAFPDFGAGFCIFNDLAVTARLLCAEGLVQRVLIVDLDVHQGDGTAFIFQEDARVFTFSMHCAANFPLHKQASDLDVPLPVGMTDKEYLKTLNQHLPRLLREFQPDLVLYDAGVDPHNADRLGKLALTNWGLYERDLDVLSTCVARGVPVAAVIGGGYGDSLPDLVARHALLHRAASEVYQRLVPPRWANKHR